MIPVAAAAQSEMYTTTFMKGAKIAGVSKEEISEAIIVACHAKGSAIFPIAVEGFEQAPEG